MCSSHSFLPLSLLEICKPQTGICGIIRWMQNKKWTPVRTHLDGIWYDIMTLSSALAISSQRGSWRTYLIECSPSPCVETLAGDWPTSEASLLLALCLAFVLGLFSRESTLPKYLLVWLLPIHSLKKGQEKSQNRFKNLFLLAGLK